MIWSAFLAVACLGGDPLYDADPDHPWNAVHRIFYARRFSNGVVYEHEAAFDPPWSNWSRFYNDEEFHKRVIGVLDAFLKQPEADVERQPALRRALLLRDLWPVFDAQTVEDRAKDDAARARQQAIRDRVAKAMRRLELSKMEVQHLPDNLGVEGDRETFPATFDPGSPDSAFLPRDLFDEKGPWVPFAPRKQPIGARGHLSQAGFRSVFVPFVRVSGDRQATREALRLYSLVGRKHIPLPKGTMTALVRRMALPTRSGEILVTPIVESLQLAVVDEPQDRRFKFVMDRAGQLARGRGLRAVGKDESLDAWGFGSLRGHHVKYDTDGDELAFGAIANPASKGYPAMSCMICHSKRGELFANSVSSFAAADELPFDDQVRAILSQKSESESWKAYQTLTSQPVRVGD